MQNQKVKLLIVDDEAPICEILRFNLEKEYDVCIAGNGVEALEKYRAEHPALILLDIMLPELDGFEVLQEIRKTDKLTSIIMLTAREREEDVVAGFSLGADDYIKKPFSIPELRGRIAANLRRNCLSETGVKSAGDKSKGAEITIDMNRFDVFRGTSPCGLTPREFELITFLHKNPMRVFSREELMRDVWHYDYYGDLRAVDVCVRRLREKIEQSPAEPEIIRTKRGQGYYFAKDDASSVTTARILPINK
ncbi:MAG: response regulator transcription factor [Oscillospiraceae bacterium]|nr:response regulator transcription factor [Oscillospiraceae bacterium]